MRLYYRVIKIRRIITLFTILCVIAVFSCLYFAPLITSSSQPTSTKLASKVASNNQCASQNVSSSSSSKRMSNVALSHTPDNHIDINHFFQPLSEPNKILSLNNKRKPVAFDYSINQESYKAFLFLRSSSTESNDEENLWISNSNTIKDSLVNNTWKFKIIISDKHYSTGIKTARVYFDQKKPGASAKNTINIAVSCHNKNVIRFGLISLTVGGLLKLEKETTQTTVPIQEIASINYPAVNQNDSDDLLQSWIYIIPGNNYGVSQKLSFQYDFAIFCFFNEKGSLVRNFPQKLQYLNVSDYSFGVLWNSNKTLEWSSSPLFYYQQVTDKNWKLTEVACQTVLPQDFKPATKANNYQPLISNDYDKIFFKSESSQQGANNHEMIYYFTLSEVNDYLDSTVTAHKVIKLGVFLFYDSYKNINKVGTINYQIHQISNAIISVHDLQFGIEGRIFFILDVGLQHQTAYLCMLTTTYTNDSKSLNSEATEIVIVFNLKGTDTYVISLPFMFDSCHQIKTYDQAQHFKDLQPPQSSIFFTKYDWNKKEYVLIMCPVNQIGQKKSNSAGLAVLKNYAIIDDLAKISFPQTIALNVMSYNWIFNKSFNNGPSTDHTSILITIKGVTDPIQVYKWTWISASEYQQVIQKSSFNSCSWWKGLYYDSYRQQVFMTSERSLIWTKNKFPTNKFDWDKNDIYSANEFNYLNIHVVSNQSQRLNSPKVVINVRKPLAMVFDNDQKAVTLNNVKILTGQVLLNLLNNDSNDKSATVNPFQSGYFLTFNAIKASNDNFTIQYSVNSRIDSTFVHNPELDNSPGNAFFKYQPNKDMKTNINKKRTSKNGEDFYGDLVNLNYDFNSAGHLGEDKSDYFTNKNKPISFYYFLNANLVKLSLQNLFNKNSNYQIRFFEIIPIVSYRAHSPLGNDLFSGSAKKSRMFTADSNGTIYEQQNNRDLEVKNKYLALKAIYSVLVPSQAKTSFSSGRFQTRAGGDNANLFLLNFYNSFYTSTTSILIQLGGRSIIDHISLRTNIDNSFLSGIYRKFTTTLIIISILLVFIFIILWLVFVYLASNAKLFKVVKSAKNKLMVVK